MVRLVIPAPETITPTTPLRLDDAARIAFPDGSVGAGALRTEARRGNLQIETIANKQFTTLQAIEVMREKCRGTPRARASGSNQQGTAQTANSINTPTGSSATDRVKLARAALETTARKLSENSPTT